MTHTTDLAAELISKKSLSPDDAGCQEILRDTLQKNGFTITDYSRGQVTNTWAVKTFGEGPLLAFAGHTDVVVPGDTTDWLVDGIQIDPFTLNERDGHLYGRGVADMKGAVAAMVIATEEFLSEHSKEEIKGSIAFALTSDEEAERIDGTRAITEALKDSNTEVDYVVVGEASSIERVADRVFIARRGSFHLKSLIINGLVGHVAKDNGIDASEIAIRLQHMALNTEWDENPDERYPKTSFKTWTINGGYELENMVAGSVEIQANWRNNPATSADMIKEKFEAMARTIYSEVAGEKQPQKEQLVFNWGVTNAPYATEPLSNLVKMISDVVEQATGTKPELSGGGGASDGSFFAEIGSEVIELGVQGGSIHEANEHVPVGSLDELKDIYKAILAKTLS